MPVIKILPHPEYCPNGAEVKAPPGTSICDALLEESAGWLWIGGRIPDPAGRVGRNPGLFERYAARLPELLGS